jgi:ABC-type Na+ efflux pump permease subunit
MRPMLLIAANFLRQHRWPVWLMFAWIILLASASVGFGRGRPVADDVAFYMVQQAIFICVFSAFLAAGAIQNERKSRRILLVLSKAISRGEYLLAIILGTSVMAIAYALVYGVCCAWLDDRATLPSTGLWELVLLVILGSILAATLALFFSTFLNSYVAIAATMLLFAAPVALPPQRHHWFLWLPGFPILLQIVGFRIQPEWTPNWKTIILAVLHCAIFWTAAAAIFSRRDIAVPVE